MARYSERVLNIDLIQVSHKVFLDSYEMAALTGIGKATIDALIAKDECSGFRLKLGKKTLIKKNAFVDYLLQQSAVQ